MTEMEEENGPAAKVIWARGVGYEHKDEDCEVHCYVLDDSGVQWLFKRAGREIRVRLSHLAMEAVFDLWQRALWEAPRVPGPAPPDQTP